MNHLNLRYLEHLEHLVLQFDLKFLMNLMNLRYLEHLEHLVLQFHLRFLKNLMNRKYHLNQMNQKYLMLLELH